MGSCGMSQHGWVIVEKVKWMSKSDRGMGSLDERWIFMD